MTGVIVTAHAHQRAIERFGWGGSIMDLAERISNLRVTSAAIDSGLANGDWRIRVPSDNMTIIMKNRYVVTVLCSGRAQNPKNQNAGQERPDSTWS